MGGCIQCIKPGKWKIFVAYCTVIKYYFHLIFLQRWFFSGHFDPVLTWGFNPGGKVSEHLKVTFFI